MVTKGMLRDRARGMRKEPSQAERALWSILRDRKLMGAKFRRQHPISPYIADFACIEARLIVEVDGRSHDDEQSQAYDQERTEALSGAGWRVVRVRDGDLLADPRIAVAQIMKALGAAPSP